MELNAWKNDRSQRVIVVNWSKGCGGFQGVAVAMTISLGVRAPVQSVCARNLRESVIIIIIYRIRTKPNYQR